MSFNSIQITAKGRDLLARAQVGTTIKFTHIKMGDGEITTQVIDEMVDVISLKKSIIVNAAKVLTGGKAKVQASFTNQGLPTGFYWREIAVFATDPDNGANEIMYCYGNAGALADYIPAGGSQVLEKAISVLTVVSNATNVTTTIEEGLSYITANQIDVVGGVASYDIVNRHITDSIYQTAGGTATAITLTTLDLVDGYTKTFIASASNNGAATSINGIPLYKPNTTMAPVLIAGKAYTVWYNLASNCFFIKASATGKVTSDKVLAGETYCTEEDTDLIGEMPNIGSVGTVNMTKEGEIYTIPQGYHNGLGKVKAVISGILASVIKAGTMVGGIIGTFTADATATSAQILTGSTAYINGLKVTGAMPNNTTDNTACINISTVSGRLYMKPPQGYYNPNSNWSWIYRDDANFVSENISSEKTIFGLKGTYSNIKSIQRILVQPVLNPNVDITAVDLNKSVIFVAPNNENQSWQCIPTEAMYKVTFVNNTKIRIEVSAAGTAMLNAQIMVVEFNNVKSIQRGTYILQSKNVPAMENITVTPVNTNKSILVWSSRNTNVAGNNAHVPSMRLSANNNIIAWDQSCQHEFAWQLVEFN